MMNANEIRSEIRTLGLAKSKIQEAGIREDRLDFILAKPAFMSQAERIILEKVINETKAAKVQIVPTSDEDPRTIILQKMKDNKISAKKLSEVSGLAYNTVANFVHGTRVTTKKTISTISNAVEKIIQRSKIPSPITSSSTHHLEKIKPEAAEAAKDEKEDRAVRVETKSTPVPVYKRFDDARKLLVLTFNDGSYLELYGLLNSGVRGIYYNASISKEEKINYDTKLDNKESVRKIKSIHFIEELFREIGLSIDNYLDEIGTIAGL